MTRNVTDLVRLARRGRRATATAVVLAVVAACGGGGGGTLAPEDVEEVIVDALDERDIDAEATCPDDIEVSDGTEFSCDVETDGGLDFEVDGEVDGDDGEFTLTLPGAVTRAAIEDAIVEALDAQVEEAIVADCSQLDEELIVEDGDEFFCGVAGVESGDALAASIVVDSAEDLSFDVELVDVGLTGDDDADEDEEAGSDLPPAEEITFVDSFDDNENLWSEGTVEGLEADIHDGIYEWNATDSSSLPFLSFPDALLPHLEGLQSVVVSARVVVDPPGRVGIACMIADPGSSDDFSEYDILVDADGLYIERITPGGSADELAELTGAEFPVDPAEELVLVVQCTHDPGSGATEITAAIAGTDIELEVSDDDGIPFGIAGLLVSTSGDGGFFAGFDDFELESFDEG